MASSVLLALLINPRGKHDEQIGYAIQFGFCSGWQFITIPLLSASPVWESPHCGKYFPTTHCCSHCQLLLLQAHTCPTLTISKYLVLGLLFSLLPGNFTFIIIPPHSWLLLNTCPYHPSLIFQSSPQLQFYFVLFNLFLSFYIFEQYSFAMSFSQNFMHINIFKFMEHISPGDNIYVKVESKIRFKSSFFSNWDTSFKYNLLTGRQWYAELFIEWS